MTTARKRGVRPDVITYTSVISACARARPPQPEKALALLATMRAKGLEPDLVTYTVVMDACAKGRGPLKKPTDAKRPSRSSMRRALAASASASTDASPSSAVNDTIKIRQSIQGGRSEKNGKDRNARLSWAEEEKIVNEAVAAMWRGITARTGPEMALELLDDMRAKGMEPEGRTYGCAIAACAKEGRWERALELLESAKKSGSLRNLGLPAYNSALHACEKGGQAGRAIALLDQMEAEGISPDVRSYTAAIGACGKTGNVELWLPEAMNLLTRAKNARSPAAKPNVFAYSAAISVCAKAGQSTLALELLNEMETSGLEPDAIAFNSALHACHRGADWEGALQTFDRMKKTGQPPDIISITDVLGALWRSRGLSADMTAARLEADGQEGIGEASTQMKRRATTDSKEQTSEPDFNTYDLDYWSDRIFEGAVSQRPHVIFYPPCLDTLYERDLSGMTLPVARVAIRWALRRILREKGILPRTVASAFTDDDDDFSEELELHGIEDPGPFAPPIVLERPGTKTPRVGPELTFITGVGVAKTRMRGKYRTTKAANHRRYGRTLPVDGESTSLREFIQEMLRNEFNPPLITYIPERLPGTVAIREGALKAWIQAQRENPTLL